MSTMPTHAEPFEYPPPSREISGGWLALLKVFGPGAIIASVTVGTGETIFAPRMGAIFGYAMFWVVMAAVVAKALLVYGGMRHLVLTGEHPMAAWARLPGPRGWVPALVGAIVVISFPLWIAALSDAVGSICIWVTGFGAGTSWGRPFWGTTVIVFTMLLTLVQTYDVLERVSFVFLGLKILFVLVACIVVKPDWFAALAGLLPALPDYPSWALASYPELQTRPPIFEIATLLGTVGGGVQDYVGYVSCAREKQWGAAGVAGASLARLPGDGVSRGRQWLKAPAFDTVSSFASVFVMTGLFMLLGAAVLHPQHQIPTNSNLYGQQAQFLGVVHPALVHVYKAGIFFAMLGAVYGCFEVYARSLFEPVRALWPDRALDLKRLRLWNTLYCGIGGLLILWTGLQTVKIVTIVSPFSGVLGCGLWCLAMLVVDRMQMPKAYRMGAALKAGLWIAGLGMAAAGAYTTWTGWLPLVKDGLAALAGRIG
jgi:Mn2+/Fe2+ NRAMP family transporter